MERWRKFVAFSPWHELPACARVVRVYAFLSMVITAALFLPFYAALLDGYPVNEVAPDQTALTRLFFLSLIESVWLLFLWRCFCLKRGACVLLGGLIGLFCLFVFSVAASGADAFSASAVLTLIYIAALRDAHFELRRGI